MSANEPRIKPRPLSETHLQTIVLTLSDGRKGRFTGPALFTEDEIDHGDVWVIKPIEVTPPRPLPPGAHWEEIPKPDQKGTT